MLVNCFARAIDDRGANCSRRESIAAQLGRVHDADVDVALLPSGDTYTMDLDEAAEAALIIKPKIAIPMHLKGADPAIFKEKVESQSDIKVVILGEGEEYTLE